LARAIREEALGVRVMTGVYDYYHFESTPENHVEAVARAIEVVLPSEFDSLVARMQLVASSLFDEYSRLKSEAELRFSIAAPLALISCTAAWLSTWWWLTAISLPTVLAFRGLSAQAAARNRVWQSLTTGVIESPTVERLARVLDEQRRRPDEQVHPAPLIAGGELS
jgi:hypothetical protein